MTTGFRRTTTTGLARWRSCDGRTSRRSWTTSARSSSSHSYCCCAGRSSSWLGSSCSGSTCFDRSCFGSHRTVCVSSTRVIPGSRLRRAAAPGRRPRRRPPSAFSRPHSRPWSRRRRQRRPRPSSATTNLPGSLHLKPCSTSSGCALAIPTNTIWETGSRRFPCGRAGKTCTEDTDEVNVAADTIAERATGERPSVFKSALTAAVIGGAAAVLTYRLLRRPGDATGVE